MVADGCAGETPMPCVALRYTKSDVALLSRLSNEADTPPPQVA